MNESRLRQRVVRLLSEHGLDAVSVENSAYPGTPDINYVGGWVELKWVQKRPKRAPVRTPHFTPQQRVWLRRRWHAGGRAYLLLQVEDSYYLFNGCVASRLLGELTCEILDSGVLGEDSWVSMGESLAHLPELLTEARTEEKCCGRRIISPRE